MPMNRSGRSVDAASRVIEIEEVLVPMMASALSERAKAREDGTLDVFLLGRSLDDEVAVLESFESLSRPEVLERGLPLLLADATSCAPAGQGCR